MKKGPLNARSWGALFGNPSFWVPLILGPLEDSRIVISLILDSSGHTSPDTRHLLKLSTLSAKVPRGQRSTA